MGASCPDRSPKIHRRTWVGPGRDNAVPNPARWRCGYDPQTAYAVTEVTPLPLTTTTPVAVQPVPVPFGADVPRAMRAEPPCPMIAPPPSSLLPTGQVAPAALVTVPSAAPLAACTVVPVTTV